MRGVHLGNHQNKFKDCEQYMVHHTNNCCSLISTNIGQPLHKCSFCQQLNSGCLVSSLPISGHVYRGYWCRLLLHKSRHDSLDCHTLCSNHASTYVRIIDTRSSPTKPSEGIWWAISICCYFSMYFHAYMTPWKYTTPCVDRLGSAPHSALRECTC